MISRFCFNISLYENLKNIFRIIFFKDIMYDEKLKKKLSNIYDKSEFYFFDYGRTAFYEILTNKITINPNPLQPLSFLKITISL